MMATSRLASMQVALLGLPCMPTTNHMVVPRMVVPRMSVSAEDDAAADAAAKKAAAQAELDRKLDVIFKYESGSKSSLLLERDGLLGTIDSSDLLRRDEEAEFWPQQLSTDPDEPSMLWVDELSCIGCRYCATIARSTFSMCDGDEDFGTARVTQQGGDEDEVVEEAIDVCPVNCIHFCSRNELETLEEYRKLYLYDLLAACQTRKLVSEGDGGGGSAAPYWRDPLINTGWRKGAKYVRSARLKLEQPRIGDE